MVYTASFTNAASPTANTTKITQPVIDTNSSSPTYNQIIMDVDTGTRESYSFWIHLVNAYGTYVVSEPIAITVLYNCTYDVITHSTIAPDEKIDKPPSELTFISANINSIKPNVELNYTTG